MTDDFDVEEAIHRMVQRITNSFGVWLENSIKNETNSEYWQGYEFSLKDDDYQVVFAFQKNGVVEWWKHLGEDK